MSRNPLASVHEEMGAFLVELAGITVPGYYENSSEETRAVRKAAGVFDLTSAGKLAVRGAERVRFLQGVLTADIERLGVGQGALSLLLTRDGRIASPLRVVVLEDEILLLTPSVTRGKVLRLLTRLIAATDAEVLDHTGEGVLLSVQGPNSGRVVPEVLGCPVPGLADFASAAVSTESYGDVRLIRSPRSGEESLDLLLPGEHAPGLFRALVEAVRACGGSPAGLEALDWLRIEMGLPAYGADIDERTLPHEAGLVERAIDLDKGCFLGYESVAQVEFHGRPERKLRGVVFQCRIAPVRDDRLFHDGQEVGVVTSSCNSPTLDMPIALAMLAHPQVRTSSVVRTQDDDLGIVSPLPFPR